MLFETLLLLVVSCCLHCSLCAVVTEFHQLPLEQTWTQFRLQHDKRYSSPDEESVRKQIFAENLKKIEVHNYLYSRGLRSFAMGINQFTDMDTLEVARTMNGLRFNLKSTRSSKHSATGSTYLPLNIAFTAPTQIDWRTQGYVTPVKNQLQCGSCWAFSATGAVEGQHFRKTQKLVSLSEQNLVDCSRKQGNNGCEGGLMDNAFTYIKENNGIDTEESYPYKGKEDTECHFNASTVGAVVTGFVDIASGDEQKLMEAVSTVGPVSVAIDAGHDSFMSYKEGVYDEPSCSSTNLDHGVLVVGYGTTPEGLDYWIVKNSWAEGWGEKGYIRMSRNKNNQCGIATAASYPLV